MMTANERRGLIALVALLALVVIIVAGTSRCSNDPTPTAVTADSTAIAADSLAAPSDSIKDAKDTTNKKTKKSRKKHDINKANRIPAKQRDPLEKAEQVN